MNSGRAVFIAGMHRSGTSMVARLLHSYGYYLGPNDQMVPANPGNPEGHWENTHVMDLNDRILSALGGSWAQPPLIPNRWEKEEFAALAKEIVPLLDSFERRKRWASKDPRHSLTLSFWGQFLPDLSVVICLRNPLEVAASLHRRDGLPFAHSLQLWRDYNQQILNATDPQQRIITHYGCYLLDAEKELKRVLTFLNRRPTQRALSECTSTVQAGLRHTRFTAQDLMSAEVPPATVQLYLLMCEQAGWDDWLGQRTEGGTERREANSANETLDSLREEALRSLKHTTSPTQFGWMDRGLGQSVSELTERIQGLEAKLVDLTERNEEFQSGLIKQENAFAERTHRLEDRINSLMTDLKLVLQERNGFEERWEDLIENAERGYGKILEMDGRIAAIAYEDKPGPWKDYAVLRPRLLDRMREHVPVGSTVLVVSNGDDALVDFLGRRAWHFPRTEAGEYAGYHPNDSDAAIAQLEYWRARGADFLAFPATSSWWLEYYEELGRYLYGRYTALFSEPDLGVLFALRDRCLVVANPWRDLQEVVETSTCDYDRDPSILDLTADLDLARRFPESSVFTPPDGSCELPYLDESVDIVITDSTDFRSLASAKRVARLAVIRCLSRSPSMRDDLSFKVHSKKRKETNVRDVSIILTRSDATVGRQWIEGLLERLPRNFDGEFITEESAADGLRRAMESDGAGGSARLRLKTVPRGGHRLAFLTAAGQSATGSVLVFIDPDVVPLPGWLPPLMSVFERYPTAGAVGGKLFKPNGQLYGAGGIVFRDGSFALFGHGSLDTEMPVFNHLRAVDYCPAVLLAVRRSVFLDQAGFDECAGPTGSPVPDFGLTLNAHGHTVFCQPQSKAVCGTDAALWSNLVREPDGGPETSLTPQWGHSLREQPHRPRQLDVAAWYQLSAWRGYGVPPNGE